MQINKTEVLLKKFDYKFERKNNELIVKMDFSQRMIIDFSDSEKIKIKDKLVGWNFLTGLIEMSIKNAIIFNFLAPVFFIGLFTYTLGDDYLLVMIIAFLMIFWVLLWSNYYIIRAEHMKQTLRRWNEN